MISFIPPKPRSQIWSSMNFNVSKMVFSVAIILFSVKDVKLTVSFNRLNTVAALFCLAFRQIIISIGSSV